MCTHSAAVDKFAGSHLIISSRDFTTDGIRVTRDDSTLPITIGDAGVVTVVTAALASSEDQVVRDRESEIRSYAQ